MLLARVPLLPRHPCPVTPACTRPSAALSPLLPLQPAAGTAARCAATQTGRAGTARPAKSWQRGGLAPAALLGPEPDWLAALPETRVIAPALKLIVRHEKSCSLFSETQQCAHKVGSAGADALQAGVKLGLRHEVQAVQVGRQAGARKANRHGQCNPRPRLAGQVQCLQARFSSIMQPAAPPPHSHA